MARWLTLVLLLLPCTLRAQTPMERYRDADRRLAKHVAQYDFLHDGSSEAKAALSDLWQAAADFAVAELTAHPDTEPAELADALCSLRTSPEDCRKQNHSQPTNEVLKLGPGLYAVAFSADSGDDFGTVFVLGTKGGHPAVVWTIAQTHPSRTADPEDLIGAWAADRAGSLCRGKGSQRKAWSCGPLFATLGALPADAQGRPRFYVDAAYEQSAGATTGEQTSLWRWEGDRAELQFVTLYSTMIDGGRTTFFDQDKATLVLAEKGSFRTMYDCGACLERPLEHRILMTATGVEDLGTFSLVPEMDFIDSVRDRMARKADVSRFASPQAVSMLRANREFDMVSGHTQSTATGANVCLSGDAGDFRFTLRRTKDGGFYLERAEALPPPLACPTGTFGPQSAR